jgi:hypothetical protein
MNTLGTKRQIRYNGASMTLRMAIPFLESWAIREANPKKIKFFSPTLECR